MLRKDKALLESLTKKYGRKELVNEVKRNEYEFYHSVKIDTMGELDNEKEISFWYDDYDLGRRNYKTIRNWKELSYVNQGYGELRVKY